jgi:hypothetical protein
VLNAVHAGLVAVLLLGTVGFSGEFRVPKLHDEHNKVLIEGMALPPITRSHVPHEK